MANDMIGQFNEQFEKSVFGPWRGLAAAAADHAEKIAAIQVDAVQSYTTLTFKNARGMLEIRDAETFKNYVTTQPEVAKEFGERMKADSEKLTAANHDFVASAQKVTQDGVASVQKAAEQGAEKVQQVTKGAGQ